MSINRAKHFVVTGILILLALVSAYAPLVRADEKGRTLEVDRVVDGDTFRSTEGERIRLLGVDTPELSHPARGEEPYARAAKEYLHRLIDGHMVRVQTEGRTTDKFGRTLAYVFLDDGRSVNELLLMNGYAKVYLKQNFVQKKWFKELEFRARRDRKGLWAEDSPRPVQ